MENIFESLKTLVKGGNKRVAVDSDFYDGVEGANLQEIANFLQSVREKSLTRSELIGILKTMARDSVVGSAIELYAEDATQIDPDTGHSFWVEPIDVIDDVDVKVPRIIDDINRFLHETLKLDSVIYNWAYNLVAYGEVYLKTYHSEIEDLENKQEKDKLREKKGLIYELVENPLEMSHILEYGNTVGYTRVIDKKEILYPIQDYIHILNDRGNNRTSVTLSYLPKGAKERISKEFKVVYGTSFIETAIEAFEILQLIELILLVSRFNKSSFFRLFKVEVGGSTRKEITQIISELKRKVNTAETLSIPQGRYSSKSQPLPLGGILYVPVKNGKGDVVVDTVGGDLDIRSLVDVDYWRNKLFAALKVPKAYLGDEEGVAGGIGNQSLLRIDARYSRSVKHVVSCLTVGVTDIVNYYLSATGQERYIGKFKVVSSRLVTAEDIDRSETLNTAIDTYSRLVSLLEQMQVDTGKFAEYIVSQKLNMSDMWNSVEDDTND